MNRKSYLYDLNPMMYKVKARKVLASLQDREFHAINEITKEEQEIKFLEKNLELLTELADRLRVGRHNSIRRATSCRAFSVREPAGRFSSVKKNEILSQKNFPNSIRTTAFKRDLLSG